MSVSFGGGYLKTRLELLRLKRLLTLLGRLTAATYYREWAEASGEEWATAMSDVYLFSEVLGRDLDSELVRRASRGLTWMA